MGISWIRGITETAFVSAAFFFGIIYLGLSGVNIFSANELTAKGFILMFLFFLFNVYLTFNWK